MNLLEEFTLLAHDDEGRRIIDGTRLDYALGGALLVELALAERIGMSNRKVVVLDATPVGETLADETLTHIAGESRERKPSHWVRRPPKGVRQRVLDRLVTSEVLRAEHSRVLGVFPRTRYPSAHGTEPVAETAVRGRLRAAVERVGTVEPRTGALCALIAATEMDRKVFPDMDRKQVRARLAEIGEGDWAAEAVRKVIRDVQVAVAAAVVTGGGGDGGSGDGGGGGGDGGGGGGGS
ncbi:GPP34 family phosphoprotein [Actinoplanes sp. NEAU-A12]|uniref:GPP34 family phosphoprotein n=1 Tax=Actinoplanes sandaracinus TaxID=3045177 RepID=A0ABT6WH46_9ACTN|nr:GPP34 family phosphoprotein [Actinoplanes sandaracinus]MDI6099020.1 GPP34 family phosphoprotein [Actinoplanes sandaracinus]MDI6102915.1 GPP34 family phosphoprotein [Actinoplanes sandaracinus]